MNGEDMIRALGFIDETYIDEAENAKLSAKGMWIRVGSVAACLCLILAGIHSVKQRNMPAEGALGTEQVLAGGQQGSVLEDSANSIRGQKDKHTEEILTEGGEPNSYFVSAQEIRTDGGREDIVYPFVTVLRSRQELDDYCLAQGGIFDLESGFLEATQKYDDHYFADNDLILVCVEENSGSVTHQVMQMHWDNGGWIITVVRNLPREMTADMAQWHILVEVQMGKVIQPEDNVTVCFENKEN